MSGTRRHDVRAAGTARAVGRRPAGCGALVGSRAWEDPSGVYLLLHNHLYGHLDGLDLRTVATAQVRGARPVNAIVRGGRKSHADAAARRSTAQRGAARRSAAQRVGLRCTPARG